MIATYAPVVLQILGPGLGTLVNVLIVAIVIAAIIYIAQSVIPIPANVVRIIWIVFVAILAIYAIRFLLNAAPVG